MAVVPLPGFAPTGAKILSRGACSYKHLAPLERKQTSHALERRRIKPTKLFRLVIVAVDILSGRPQGLGNVAALNL